MRLWPIFSFHSISSCWFSSNWFFFTWVFPKQLHLLVLKWHQNCFLPGGANRIQLSWVSLDSKFQLRTNTKLCWFNFKVNFDVWYINFKSITNFFFFLSRVETARLILAFADADYQDVRLQWGGFSYMLLLLCYLSLPLIYSLNTCLFIISKGERQFFHYHAFSFCQCRLPGCQTSVGRFLLHAFSHVTCLYYSFTLSTAVSSSIQRERDSMVSFSCFFNAPV